MPIAKIKRPHYSIWVIYPQVGNQCLKMWIGCSTEASQPSVLRPSSSSLATHR